MKKKGGKCYKMDARLYAGIPDRLVLFNGRAYFVELKAPGKKCRPIQVAFHKVLAAVGFPVSIIDTKEGVDAFIQELT
jgi:hypothetical protein